MERDDVTGRLMDFQRRVRAAAARATTGTDDDGQLYATCAGLLSELLAHAPARAQVECGRGCNFCCHQRVMVSPVEARVVAAAVMRLPADERARLRALLEQRARQSAELGDGERHWRARLPCAFLDDDGGCGVHAARPLVCRGYQSLSRSACQEKYVDDHAPVPPIDRYGHLAGNAVLEGLRDSLTAAGRGSGLGELHQAVLAELPAQT